MDRRTSMARYLDAGAVAESLGGKRVLRAEVRTIADLNRLVMAGLPFRSLRRFSAWYHPDRRTGIEQLVVPRTTMLRRERTGTLSVEESERLERVARITALAEHVLESHEEAEQFLTSPHALLDGVAPLELAATDLGARRVEAILWNLEYGLPV
jgi:putative toxin-antitoxin system antitoxin component (TIGR02293 family)